jgi:hypothetical protein
MNSVTIRSDAARALLLRVSRLTQPQVGPMLLDTGSDTPVPFSFKCNPSTLSSSANSKVFQTLVHVS